MWLLLCSCINITDAFIFLSVHVAIQNATAWLTQRECIKGVTTLPQAPQCDELNCNSILMTISDVQ